MKKRELKKLGIQGKVIPMSDFAELSLDDFAKRLTEYGVYLSTDKVKNLYEDLFTGVITKDEYIAFKEEFEIKAKSAEKGLIDAKVELKNIDNKLMVASLDNAFIKICSCEKQYEETKENIAIKIKGNALVEEKFMDRRDRLYGKSDCSYIW